jgi:L-ascorbate metabolism protein UlaG (beta-lactamase superfamily)
MQTRMLATLLALGLSLASYTADAEEQALKTAISVEKVRYQQIRNATAKISYGKTTFLVDPMLSKKGTYPGFKGTYRSELRNPLVELPISEAAVIADVDAVIVTHTHLDHWDDAAQALLPKGIPLFVQNDSDAEIIRKEGFTDVRVLATHAEFGGVTLTKTGGRHGTDAMYASAPLAAALGVEMGVVLQAPGHPTVYLAGDTLWTADVDHALAAYKPEVIVLNAGYARVLGYEGAIIMGKDDVLHAAQIMPKSVVVAVHLDAINHMALSREELRKFVLEKGIQARVEIPEDGASLEF